MEHMYTVKYSNNFFYIFFGYHSCDAFTVVCIVHIRILSMILLPQQDHSTSHLLSILYRDSDYGQFVLCAEMATSGYR